MREGMHVYVCEIGEKGEGEARGVRVRGSEREREKATELERESVGATE